MDPAGRGIGIEIPGIDGPMRSCISLNQPAALLWREVYGCVPQAERACNLLFEEIGITRAGMVRQCRAQ